MAALHLDHREIARILLDVETGLRGLIRLGDLCDTPEEEIGAQMAALMRPMVEQLRTVQETLSSYWMFVDDGLEVPHGLDVV